MRKVLVIDQEHLVCRVAALGFDRWANTQVVCALNQEQGRRLLKETSFDLALIDTQLPLFAGIALAEVAANENIPVLLLAGHPASLDRLKRYDFPFLAKPFSVEHLLYAADRAIAEYRFNLSQVRASAARLRLSVDSMAETLAVSRALLDQSKGRRLRDTLAGP